MPLAILARWRLDEFRHSFIIYAKGNIMRLCKICKIEKPEYDFTINKTSKRGKIYYKSFCKECVAIYRQISKGQPNTGRFKKGNIPATRKEINGRRSLKAKEWHDKVLKRDKYICQKCFINIGKLHAHHIKNWNDYPELRFELNNGITLCNPCHARLHGKEMCNPLKNGIPWIKGKKHKESSKKKMSDAHKGKTVWNKGLKGLTPWNKGLKGVQIAWNKGKNHTIESRKKMSESHKGKKLSLEHRGNIGAALKKYYQESFGDLG